MKDSIAVFLDHLEFQKRYSTHTIKAYRNDLMAFADYVEVFFEVTETKEVVRRMISSFIADLAENGTSSRSINRKLSAIQSYFNFQIRKGLVEANPVKSIQRPKTAVHLPTVVRSEQVKELFKPEHFQDDFEGTRNKALLSTFYACGLRREELINLKRSDIDYSAGQIKVLGKRNKERIIPVAPFLLEIFEAYFKYRAEIPSDTEVVFITSKGQKMYPGLVYNIVKNYLSNVTTLEKKSPHVLRHTFATHLLNEGANLQSIKELLGHESLATTQVYTHTSLEQLKDVYKHAHPRSKK